MLEIVVEARGGDVGRPRVGDMSDSKHGLEASVEYGLPRQ